MVGPDKGSKPASRWARELRDHPVIRVGGAYCVFAWLILQVGEVVLPSFDAPAWIMQSMIAILAGLLPVVLILARVTNVSGVIGAAGKPEADVGPLQLLEDEDEAGDILQLKSASLEIPMDLSEARQISTISCSLQGFHKGQDDPEILLGFVAGLEPELDQIVKRYEGSRLASGRNQITLAFGYPVMHEDDARRAARAGLDILALLTARDIADGQDTRVDCRCGLHTSTIIIDEGASANDTLALLGDTTGVAEYLQALAPVNGIVVSAASQEMLSRFFLMDHCGRQSHPKLGRDVATFVLGRELSGLMVNVMAEQSEVYGRDHEKMLLLQQWQTVLEGESEYVLIKGEPGMGKSSLLYATVKDLVAAGEAQLVLLTCEPYYRDSPFRPVITFFERFLYGDAPLTNDQRLEKVRELTEQTVPDMPEAVALLASLLSLDATALGQELDDSSKLQREKILGLLVAILEGYAEQLPLVLAIEDLHWADPSTRDLIERLMAYDPSSPILGIFTARPEFEPAWVNLPDVIELNLNKLPSRIATEMIQRQAADTPLAPELIQQIVESASGIPLYVEQLTRAVLESRTSFETGADTSLQIPPNLQGSVNARIEHLGSAKPLLQLCSVIGFEFSYQLLRAVCDTSDEKLLRTVLGTIVNAGLIYQKGSFPEVSFKFKHRLVMEAAYQSLLRKTRQRLHGVIAGTLEESFPEICLTRPTLAAHHFIRAGNASRAIEYWIEAAQLSQQKFANEEALAQLNRGLQALPQVADDESRSQYEITLQHLTGATRLASQGYTNPEVRVAFERALELSDKVSQSPALFKLIVGLWMYYLIRAEYDRALELTQQMLDIAQSLNEPPELLQANYCAAYTRYYKGEIHRARDLFEVALGFADGDYDYSRQTPSNDDTRIHLNCLYSLCCWSDGDWPLSQQAMASAMDLATRLKQPYGQVWALFFEGWLAHMRDERELANDIAGQMLAICKAKGFSFFIPLGMFYQGPMIGDPHARIEAMINAHEITRGTGAQAGSSFLRNMMIRELIAQPDPTRAQQYIDLNVSFMDTSGEEVYRSETLRQQALLVLLQAPEGAAENACSLLEQAVAQAVGISNKPFALRAALTLFEHTDAKARALDLIQEILDSYHAADTTVDYQCAQALVQQRRVATA